MFVGFHAIAAMRTDCPELAITDDEGRAFMKSVEKVARHYSVKTTQKTMDWIALAGITAQMYGTRAFAISQRRKAEGKGGRKDDKPAPILPLRSRGPTPKIVSEETAAGMAAQGLERMSGGDGHLNGLGFAIPTADLGEVIFQDEPREEG